jgi:hypothetical protein
MKVPFCFHPLSDRKNLRDIAVALECSVMENDEKIDVKIEVFLHNFFIDKKRMSEEIFCEM